MNAKQRAAWQKRLGERRAQLVAAGPARIEPNRKDPSAVGVADEDEQALSEMLQSLASSRNRDAARELSLIDQALRKLRDEPDEFGLCEDCGEEIAEKRLQLLPWAALCAECQGKVDPKRNVSRKKLTDYR
jgi:DnaK suppressor protein